MTSITTQQTKLDLELVPKENGLDIGKCNGRIPCGFSLREHTFQVVLDALALTACYPAFSSWLMSLKFQGRDFNPLPSEEDVVSFLRDLGHTGGRLVVLTRFVSPELRSFRVGASKVARKFPESLSILSKKESEYMRDENLEPPVETKSKRKEKVDVAHGKGLELLSEVALFEKAQMKEARKKILRDFHKTHPSGSGAVFEKPPSIEKITPTIIKQDEESNDDDQEQEDFDQENESKDDEMKSDEEQGIDDTTDQFDDDVNASLEEPTKTTGIIQGLLKGTRSNYAELEYDFEECYKALSEKLDWENPKGDDYPFDLSKPLPLIKSGKLISTMTYTTSTTKTKAAQYDLPGMEDMVPNIWSPVKVAYDKYLEEIVVRRADNDLYRFKEGDFPRIRINDIEDMLILLVRNWLTNLSGDDVVDFAIVLRMYTRSLVIQRRVEDLQLRVESCQKQINVTKPNTTRPDLRRKRHRPLPYKTSRIHLCRRHREEQDITKLLKGKEADEEFGEIRRVVFTMKMEILLEPTSNKLMVEHAEYDESNTYVLERFNTTAGNPVKKILLKLNLSDHRKLKEGGEANGALGRLVRAVQLVGQDDY
ncbi:hypothetical protein Tco_1174044 [Tanacetum coccineum]